MKSYSNIEPQQNFAVENKYDGTCDITFWVNAEWNETHEECVCDVYRLPGIRYRDALAADVEAHYDDWLAAAMAEETKTPDLTDEEKLKVRTTATEDAITAILDMMMGV